MGQKHECLVCTFQKNCSDGALFLYAATPILRDIVATHLRNFGARFRLDNELFRLEEEGDTIIRNLRGTLSDAQRADIRVSSERGAALMAAPTLDDFANRIDTSWFEEAMVSDRFVSYFQPIVDGLDARVFAHECLIRLFADRPYNGLEIMDAAVSRGRIHLFDSYARRLSIRMAGRQFRPGAKVFINFMPSSIYDPAFCMASTLDEMSRTRIRPEDVVFEVVESDNILDVKHLQKICDYYRNAGFGFALDDVGTGSNSLQMVCDLKPDYIKLDKSLISKISEPMYRTAVLKVTEFANQYSVGVIAEGVETVETREALLSLGIRLMQGYYFGKPDSRMDANCVDLIRFCEALGGSTVSPEPLPLPAK